ncbi:MAG: tetratricopeptide repeat protein [bacterium]
MGPSRRLLLIHMALLFLLSAFLYLGVLRNEFLYDDEPFIVQNAQIQHPRQFFSLFLSSYPPEEESQGFYRPVLSVSYMVDYLVYGLSSLGFHLTNLLLFALLVPLVYYLIVTATEDWLLALLAAILFAAHPVHIESVNWVSARGGILSGFGFVASLSFYLLSQKASGGRKQLFLVLGPVAYVLALGSYENAISLPIALFILGAAIASKQGTKWRETLRRDFISIYVPLIALTIVYLIVRLLVLGRLGPRIIPEGIASLGVFKRLLILPQLMAWNFWLCLFPVRLSLIHEFGRGAEPVSILRVLGGIAFVILYLGIAILSLRRRLWIGVGMLLFGVLLLPALNIVPIDLIVSERTLTLPAFGFCLAVAAIFVAALARNEPLMDSSRNLTVLTIFFVLTAAYAMKVYERSKDWRTGLGFWTAEKELHPDHAVPYNSLGYCYYRTGYMDLAESRFRVALEKDPGMALPYFNLSKLLIEQHRQQDALVVLNDALEKMRKDPEGNNLAIVGSLFIEAGAPRLAKITFDAALKMNPRSGQALSELALMAATDGHYREAAEMYNVAVANLKPSLLPLALNNQAFVLEKLGRDEEAIQVCEHAIGLSPELPGPYLRIAAIRLKQKEVDRAAAILDEGLKNVRAPSWDLTAQMALLLEQRGEPKRALTVVKEYSARAPRDQRPFLYVGGMLARNGQFPDAGNAFKEALKINPNEPLGYIGMGQVLITLGRYAEAGPVLDQALKLDPQNQMAQEAKKKLEEILRQQPSASSKDKKKSDTKK